MADEAEVTMVEWHAWADHYRAAGCCSPCARHFAFASVGDDDVPRMACSSKLIDAPPGDPRRGTRADCTALARAAYKTRAVAA